MDVGVRFQRNPDSNGGDLVTIWLSLVPERSTMHDQEELSMTTETTRRTFLGAVGAGVAMAAPRGSKVQNSTTEKCLFWVAACTPCDKNLKFDEAYYRDMMAYFKDQGADGVVVTGTTGE